MNPQITPPIENRRIIIIDDNPDIHRDITKILCRASEAVVPEAGVNAAERFGFVIPQSPTAARRPYEIASAHQGEEAVSAIQVAAEAGRPFTAAFVDGRMPPGIDGIETIKRLWLCPDLQVTLCTAYTDYSWEQIIEILGGHDNLIVLKKPFDVLELQQIAEAMIRRWNRNHLAGIQITELEKSLEELRGHEPLAPAIGEPPLSPCLVPGPAGGGERVDLAIEKSRRLARHLQARIQDSRSAIVGRLAASLRPHRAQLGAFGHKLPDFLAQLYDQLQREQISALQLVGALQASLARIPAGHATDPVRDAPERVAGDPAGQPVQTR